MRRTFLTILWASFFILICSPGFSDNKPTSTDKCLNPTTGQWEPKTNPNTDCASINFKSRIYTDPKTGLKLLVIDNFSLSDLSLEITTPSKDFNGGLGWHYINLDNNYTAMIDLKKHEVEIYKMDAGKKITLKKAKLSFKDSDAQNFKISSKKGDIQFFYNHNLALQTNDQTFKQGINGYWSKDSDNVRIKYSSMP